jgi:hypothetical protein
MEWKMINKTDTEMKEENKNSEFSTKDREMSASLDTDKLRRMGFHYPELTLRVIEAVERGDSLRSIAKIDASETGERGCVNSYVTEETERCGHQVLYVYLSDPELPFSFAETWKKPNEHKADCLLFINRKWIQIASFTIQFDIVWQLDNMGKPLEEILECLKEEDTEEAVKPEENTQTSKAPNHESKEEEDPDEEFAEKEEREQPEANPDPTMEEVDLRNALSFCKDIFEEKLGLYGGSFCFMHPETLTDQLYMKATILKKRLTERDKGERFEYDFFEGVRDEFAAVVNYGIIALRQSVFSKTKREFDAPDDLMQFYLEQTRAALSLICDKSADYGHLWRSQRIGTYADMIYTKVLRVKRIENQYRVGGMTEEGYHKFVEDQYRDLINYGLFGVVRMTEIADFMAFEMEENETDEEEGYE